MNRTFFHRAGPAAQRLACLLAATTMLNACASVPDKPSASQTQGQPPQKPAHHPLPHVASTDDANSGGIYDPWEGYNRGIFAFNEGFDQYLFRPVAKGYVYIVPEYGRQRIHNVLTNLKQPITFFNSVLQGDPGNAFSTLWTFVLNTTFGVAGVFDFAGSNTDLRVHAEDFGQTLGVWGVANGPFFELPILGPSTVRDTGGLIVDNLTNPFNYLADDEVYYSVVVVNAIDTRAGLIDALDDVHRNSLDPYATLRSAYLQKRAAQVQNSGRAGATATGPGSTLSPAQSSGSVDPAAEAVEEGILPSTSP